MESIIENNKEGVCLWCGSRSHIKEYPIFGSRLKWQSKNDGLTVCLCPKCRKEFFSDFYTNTSVKMLGEIAWIKRNGKEITDWVARYGKNYIW